MCSWLSDHDRPSPACFPALPPITPSSQISCLRSPYSHPGCLISSPSPPCCPAVWYSPHAPLAPAHAPPSRHLPASYLPDTYLPPGCLIMRPSPPCFPAAFVSPSRSLTPSTRPSITPPFLHLPSRHVLAPRLPDHEPLSSLSLHILQECV